MLRSLNRNETENREGSILTLAVFCLVLVFIFAAYSIDVASITLTKAQLQNIADASAAAAVGALGDYYNGSSSQQTPEQVSGNAAAKVTLHSKNYAQAAVEFDPAQDMKLGHYEWNKDTGAWETSWGQQPFNIVEVELKRAEARMNALPLVFGAFVGHSSAEISARSVATMLPASGFITPPPGQHVPILPIAIDLDTWIALENGSFPDNIHVDPDTEELTTGSDGYSEIEIFPNHPNASLPSGNRGTLALGGSQNSTQKLSRQIRLGLDKADFEYHGGSLSVETGPLYLEGDPGISAGIEDDLKSIIGQQRVIPVFTEVGGPGANSVYKIVRFVGVRILEVDLHGARRHKKVVLQPTPMIVKGAKRGKNSATLSDEGVVYSGEPSFILPESR